MGTAVVTHVLLEQQERLISNFVQRIVEGSDMGALRQTNAQELRGLVRNIVTSLSDYLEGDEGEVTKCFDLVGDTCFRLSIPLIETVYALYLLRDLIGEPIALDGGPEGVKKVRANKFFDRLVFEMLRHY
jgi:hypothetical protein